MPTIAYSETRSLLNRLNLSDSDIDNLVMDFPTKIKFIERPSGYKDCLEWLLDINDQKLVEENYDFIKDGEEKPGDLVWYSDHFGDSLLHIGRYLGNGRVISKWGQGPVFEHLLDFVPNRYGETVFFLREKNVNN